MVRLAGRTLVVLGLIVGCGRAEAGVIHVPRDANRLDRALSLAQNGDTVLVDPGRYPGPFWLPPGVRLESTRGAGTTMLTAPGAPSVIETRGGGSATAVVGFSLEGGRAAVELRGGVLELLRCRISGTDSLGVLCGPGGHARIHSTDVTGLAVGVSVEPGADATLINCVLRKNALGVYAKGDDTRISRCRFEENGVAVLVHPLGMVRLGGSLRDGNDLLHNPVALEVHTEIEIQATHNFWGTTDADSVAALIRGGPAAYLPFTDASHREELGARP